MSYKPLQHGEVMLVPVIEVPEGMKQHRTKSFIVAHSETGHHHVLECDQEMAVYSDEEENKFFVQLFAPGKLVHKKTYDSHKTLEADPIIYEVHPKREYNPYTRLIQEVRD